MINITAGWEKRDGRTICRWMLAWFVIEDDALIGAAAGYSGGGSFQLEMFCAKYKGNELTSLMIDVEDKITGQEIVFFEDVPQESLDLCEQCEDVILDWVDREAWYEADQLLLKNSKKEICTGSGDLLVFSNQSSIFAKPILESLGVTAAPTHS
ncbi:MAG: hypothetical protein HN616_05440 [Proteobacteria bacterium]|jgi:hypothetical protein|nr:hypothetical protein [Betaproteobacteria bacterium]MBT7561828.1 hypothetical protein [Pseudomonadota bacterium]MDG2243371.1 hypothetical protein [Rhodospirillaceae bacterium]